MIKQEELKQIGQFQKTHALKGELNVLLAIDSEYIEEGNPLITEIDGILVPWFAESVRKKGSTTFLLKLDGINSEDDAKKLVNKPIYALKETLKSFYEEEGYELQDGDDLIGFEIIDFDSGQPIGKIESINDTTTNVLFHVTQENGDTIFIPVVDEWIDEIDESGKKIMMRIPDGLVDLNAKKTE